MKTRVCNKPYVHFKNVVTQEMINYAQNMVKDGKKRGDVKRFYEMYKDTVDNFTYQHAFRVFNDMNNINYSDIVTPGMVTSISNMLKNGGGNYKDFYEKYKDKVEGFNLQYANKIFKDVKKGALNVGIAMKMLKDKEKMLKDRGNPDNK